MLIRILFIWTLRHPASGYVQGINDLATPFILVFLSEHVEGIEERENPYDITVEDLESMSNENIKKVEADSYWCLTKIIDNI